MGLTKGLKFAVLATLTCVTFPLQGTYGAQLMITDLSHQVLENLSTFQKLLQRFEQCSQTKQCSFEEKQRIFLQIKKQGQQLSTLISKTISLLLSQANSIIFNEDQQGIIQKNKCVALRNKLKHLKQVYKAINDPNKKYIIRIQGDLLYQQYESACLNHNDRIKLALIDKKIKELMEVRRQIETLIGIVDNEYLFDDQEISKLKTELSGLLQGFEKFKDLQTKNYKIDDEGEPEWLGKF